MSIQNQPSNMSGNEQPTSEAALRVAKVCHRMRPPDEERNEAVSGADEVYDLVKFREKIK